jgi:hypothetical protein
MADRGWGHAQARNGGRRWQQRADAHRLEGGSQQQAEQHQHRPEPIVLQEYAKHHRHESQ